MWITHGWMCFQEKDVNGKKNIWRVIINQVGSYKKESRYKSVFPMEGKMTMKM